MEHRKKCDQCGDGFTSNRSHTKYCSDECKKEAFLSRKKKPLGTVDRPSSSPMLNLSSPTLPPATDRAAEWIINQQNGIITKLEAEIKDLKGDVKTANLEKSEMEDQLDEMIKARDAKPSALNGFINNVSETAGKDPEILKKGLDLLNKLVPNNGLAGSAAAHPVLTWLHAQEAPVQELFMSMVQMLSKNPKDLKENIGLINRSLMEAIGEGTQESTGNKTGWGRA